MQRVIIPNVCEDELMGGSFNHLVQVVEQTRQTNLSTRPKDSTISITSNKSNKRYETDHQTL